MAARLGDRRGTRREGVGSAQPSPSTSLSGHWPDRLNQCIDNMSETRSSIREEALANLVVILSRHHCSEVLDPRTEELVDLLKKSVTRDTKEATLSAKVLALTFVNHGDMALSNKEELFQSVRRPLQSTIRNSTDIDIKVNCLHTLAFITYLTASDIDTQLIRNFLFDILETNGDDTNIDELSSTQVDQFMCAVIRGYGLLYAAQFTNGPVQLEVIQEEMDKVMSMHEILLESPDKDVRVAAGENIALIMESIRLKEEESDDDESVGHDQYVYDNMDELMHTLRELSVDSNRKRNKSDRVEQKSAFRDILKSVEEGERPVEELKIDGRVMPFRGWSKTLALQAFRRCIGEGLPHHIRRNDLLRQVFGYSSRFTVTPRDTDDSDDDEDDVSDLVKSDRLYVYGESKKARDKHRKKAREGRLKI